jgi:cell shape-determining protein MreC
MAVVAYSLVLARVPSVRNFNSIIILFSDHMLDIGVKENNGVTL